MKTKNDLTVLIITSLICLLPMVLSLVLFQKLPEQVAIHWNIVGEADRFAPKAVAAFGLPLLFFAMNFFSKLFLYNDPRRANTSHAIQIFAAWLIPASSLLLVPLTLFMAMGVKIPLSLIIPVLVGIVLIICGNYLPKSRQNYTLGIRLPWTLHNADNWNKTHRLAGYLWILGGILLIAGSFLFPQNNSFMGSFYSPVSILALLVLLLTILPALYSYFLYRKTGNSNSKTDDSQ